MNRIGFIGILALIFAVINANANIQRFTFNPPIDALSLGFEVDEIDLAIEVNGDWITLEIEKEFDPMLRESNLVMFPKPVSTVHIKGTTQGFELHPIRISKEPPRYDVAALSHLGTPKILLRRQWGANDSFLYRGPAITRSDVPAFKGDNGNGNVPERVKQCEQWQRDFPYEFQAANTQETDANGKNLRWARRYSKGVELLVVHHTALKVTRDPRPPIERIRALYEYHANGRGWGDIGYHYLIDEKGQIYEGRSGGDFVVGGHVYCGNIGTVGIALMGNFDIEKPTQDQITSLQWLLSTLGKKYRINLRQNAFFHGKNVNPIVRHKDLIATVCPGYYVDRTIAQIRSNVISGNLHKGVAFPQVARRGRVDRTQERKAVRRDLMGRRFYRAKRRARAAKRLRPEDRTGQSVTVKPRRDGAPKRQRVIRTAQGSSVSIEQSSSSVATSVPVLRNIRIRLSFPNTGSHIVSNSSIRIEGRDLTAQSIIVQRDGGSCSAFINGRRIASGIVRLVSSTPIVIQDWRTKSNRFRGIIECRMIDDQLILINELPLDDYLLGLSEQPDTEPFEKQKAFAIAARSYAAFYLDDTHRKFPGMPYDGSDSAAVFQRYNGLFFEGWNPEWLRAVRETAGQVLMKDGGIVKAAYFSQSDGRTRSPEENGWSGFPYSEVFQSKPDPWCEGMQLRGHGVGMSGCGAEAQANLGVSAEKILEYYYPGTAIGNL